jgi:hypothetical protein
MATNSTDNPAPLDNLNVFNPAEWGNTTKSTSTTNNDIATQSGENNYTGTNDFQNPAGITCNSSIIVNSAYHLINGAGYITNASPSITLPMYPIYTVNLTANLVITLPTANVNLVGCRIIFRRISINLDYYLQTTNIIKTTNYADTLILLNNNPDPNNSVILTCIADPVSSIYYWIKLYTY